MERSPGRRRAARPSAGHRNQSRKNQKSSRSEAAVFSAPDKRRRAALWHRRQPPAQEVERARKARATHQCANHHAHIALAWSATAFGLLLCAGGALGSPPIDFLVYTSQLATARAGTQSVASILPSLKSIYTPALDGGSQAAGNGSRRALDDMSARVFALVANSSHQHDSELSDLAASQFAWNLMEKQALVYMENRVNALRPFLQELLVEANVGRACNASLNLWLNELASLKQWATLMWNSWGQFPTAGLFQGSYTDLGSYKSCMAIEDNELIGEPQYCLLDFQPLVPARPRFHSIFKRILGYDASRRQLTAGDFEGRAAGPQLVAHGVPSARYNELYATRSGARELASDYRHPRPQASEEERLLLAALASEPELGGGGAENATAGGKYSKRTIVQPSALGAELEAGAAGPAVRPLAGGQLQQQQPLNLTLKAEALIELALRAQYFYYVKFRIGSCLPSKCSQADVSKLARAASQRAILQSVQVNCMKREPDSLNTYQLVAICILSVLALIALLGAAVDLLGYKENLDSSSALINWLLPFSIWTNAKRLFDLQAAGTHSDLGCVHGLRFFSMLWVIYGHTILYMEYQSFTHFYDVVEQQISSFLLLPTLNANFSVDTFFVISGILTTYVTWEYTRGDARKFNKFAFMISRYIRLTPQLAIVILCFFLLPLLADGPLYRQAAEDKARACYQNWAINLLYLQSYVNADKLCIDPSWWLSIEMTFHVLSGLVIIVMIQNVRRGMVVNFVLASALMLWGATIHYTNGMAIQYLPSIPQRYEVAAQQTKLFFHRPYPHAASYFIGIALGYVLANKTIKKLTRAQLVQGWLVCALGLVASLWGSYFWNLGAPYNQLQATLYYNLCQILWPTSIAWIILACSLGHGGPVNAILSARLFVPLGRVTYMTYLSHALIIYYHSARMSIALEPSMLLFIYLFIANTSLALALGVVLTVVYESPILNLQKQLFAYLTEKFDPAAKRGAGGGLKKANSACKPILLQETRAGKHENGLAAANGSQTMALNDGGAATAATMSTSILVDGEQNALLVQPNGKTMNGSAALSQCLVLDANSDKRSNQAAE